MTNHFTRRRFILRSMEGLAAATILPHVSSGSTPLTGTGLAIVGLGGRGAAILDECRRHSIPVTAVCDADALALRKTSAAFPHAAGFADFRELAKSEGAEAIALAVPFASSLAEAAMMRFPHVYLHSSDRLDRDAVERLAKAADSRNNHFGLAPYDPSWDVELVDHLLNAAIAQADGGIRFSLRLSPASVQEGVEPGFDVLRHATTIAGTSTPTLVRAVRAGRNWGAMVSLSSDRNIELCVQEDPQLRQGEASLAMEFRKGTANGRVVVDSVTEPDGDAGKQQKLPPVYGFARFMRNTGYASESRRETAVTLSTLRWTAMIRSAFENGGLSRA